MKAWALVAWRVVLITGLAAAVGLRVADAPVRTNTGALYTSPSCDHIVGYSGPNDCEIEMSADGRIDSVTLLASRDTAEHAAEVREDPEFLAQFRGVDPRDARAYAKLDGVSRATLTSFAILEAVAERLGGPRISLRFPEDVRLEEVRALLPGAHRIDRGGVDRGGVDRGGVDREGAVFDAASASIGAFFRTGPGGEAIVGYQGPTDVLVVLDGDGIRGIALRKSYDNERYVDYVREDVGFAEQFVGKTRAQVAGLLDGGTFEAHEKVDGVSGATMTSHAVAEGIVRAAALPRRSPRPESPWFRAADVGTLLAVALAIALTFSRRRGGRRVRIATRIAIVVYLGVMAGAMLSQDLFVGWATNGLPWRAAPGLVVLGATALLIPVATGRQTYCHQLCPHGALQELLRRTPWQRPVPRRASRVLRWVPGSLLAVVGLAVAWGGSGFPYAALEPFGAWAFPLAGIATCVLAVVGLAASTVWGMAYCRMGCPTGALLDFVRRRNIDRWRLRDTVATVIVAVAVSRTWLAA